MDTAEKEGGRMTKKEQRRRDGEQAIREQLQPIADNAQDEESRSIILSIIERIAYLTIALGELENQTVHEGYIVHYDNGGGQEGIRQHPALTAYGQLHKSWITSIKALKEFMDNEAGGTDEFQKFIEQHDGV